jgi:S1-C subfamily serine protease
MNQDDRFASEAKQAEADNPYATAVPDGERWLPPPPKRWSWGGTAGARQPAGDEHSGTWASGPGGPSAPEGDATSGPGGPSAPGADGTWGPSGAWGPGSSGKWGPSGAWGPGSSGGAWGPGSGAWGPGSSGGAWGPGSGAWGPGSSGGAWGPGSGGPSAAGGGTWGPGPGGWRPGGGWYSPGAGAPGRPGRTLPAILTALLVVVAVLVGLGIGHGVWRSIRTLSPTASPGIGGGGGGVAPLFGGSGPSNVASIAAKVAPALVDINMTMSYNPGVQGAGTGIVLTSNGEVLTNNHVVEGATSITATDVGNGRTYPVEVLGYSRTQDIALVQLQGASGLTTATIGDSSKITVGEQVVGVGNAGGAGGTPSAAGGVVTALDQSITAFDQGNGSSEQLTGLIQVNANIQEGDSGGALVNTSGQVIGMDTAASQGFSFEPAGGEGFAIPINRVTRVAEEITAGQASSTVHIGPTAYLGVLVSNTATPGFSGVALDNVVPGTPAARVGLGRGDYITALGGKQISTPSQLTDALVIVSPPGDRVTVAWVDPSGQSHEATVQLASGPAQ